MFIKKAFSKFINPPTDDLRFANYTTIVAFITGLVAYSIPMAAEHIYFFISAPLAAWLTGYLIWKFVFKRATDYKTGNLIGVAVVVIPFIHFLNFLILNFGRIICYHLTGSCVDYSGHPLSISEAFLFSFPQTLISLYKIGWITLPAFIFIGIYVLKTSKIGGTGN